MILLNTGRHSRAGQLLGKIIFFLILHEKLVKTEKDDFDKPTVAKNLFAD